MEKETLKLKIDELLEDLVNTLKEEVSYCLDSIILVGSYTIGKISLERPNVNVLIFLNDKIKPEDYLRIGDIFYKTGDKYKDYFSIKIDSLPFRFGIPNIRKEPQLVLTPNLLLMSEKNIKPPFGIPKNVLEGMASTSKVMFGPDPLSKIDLTYSKQEFLQWAFHDIGILFRNLLTRAPLSYQVENNVDLLAHESVELGKIALYWGTEVFLEEKDIKAGKHIEMIKDSKSIVDFYNKIDKDIGKAAEIILEAREHFREYKKDKKKAFLLYNAAFVAIHKVFYEIIKQMNS